MRFKACKNKYENKQHGTKPFCEKAPDCKGRDILDL